MRKSLFLAFALAAGQCLAQEEAQLLSPGKVEPEWSRLASALASKGNIQAPFTERRYFPFRRKATELHGILRVAREGGLSLQYTDPDPSVLIADSAGLVFRDSRGRSHALSAASEETGPLESLLSILRFDLDALSAAFEIRAARSGAEWRFVFTPRSARVAQTLGTVTVKGAGEGVRHLEFRRSGSQRVEIDVGEARTEVSFTPAEMARFFR